MDGGFSDDANGGRADVVLVLSREDLTNQVEGHSLQSKTTAVACWFLIEEVICRYGCVGKIAADGGELEGSRRVVWPIRG